MGLFDTIRSSYDLGEHFTDVELQTKGLDCTMTEYWISPDGCLYEMVYSDTHTFEIIEEGDERYDPNRLFLNFEWIPTGNRGKVRPCYVTDYVRAYPARWDGPYDDWPEVILHFRCGKLQDYAIKSKRNK